MARTHGPGDRDTIESCAIGRRGILDKNMVMSTHDERMSPGDRVMVDDDGVLNTAPQGVLSPVNRVIAMMLARIIEKSDDARTQSRQEQLLGLLAGPLTLVRAFVVCVVFPGGFQVAKVGATAPTKDSVHRQLTRTHRALHDGGTARRAKRCVVRQSLLTVEACWMGVGHMRIHRVCCARCEQTQRVIHSIF